MKTLVLLVLCLLATSCSRQNARQESEGINIDLTSDTEKAPLTHNDAMTIHGWIALDTCEQALLPSLQKIEKHDNRFFILDRVHQKGVVVFDEKGKYLYRIGKQGQGPGEYPDIYDFTIDRRSNRVVILSPASSVNVYTCEGEFLDAHRELDPTLLWNLTRTEDGYLMSTNHQTYTEGENAYLLYCFDNDFRLKWKDIPVYKKQISMSASTLLSSALQAIGNCTYYCDSPNYRIYSTGSDKGELRQAFDISLKNPAPVEAFTDPMAFMQHQREYSFITECAITERWLILHYVDKGQMKFALVDRENGNVVRNGAYQGVVLKMFYLGDNLFASPVTAEEYLTYWSKQPVPQPQMSPDAEDNMLLLLWSPKA